MTAPLRLSDSTLRISDLQFLAQLKTATRPQLRTMRKVFTQLGGPNWKRAAVARELARREGQRVPFSFRFVVREELE